MAVFVDLDDDDVEPPQDVQPRWTGDAGGLEAAVKVAAAHGIPIGVGSAKHLQCNEEDAAAHKMALRENPNWNAMTRALGCYPVILSVASSIDLNTLDNLARTCRQIRAGLLQYRTALLVSTMHCSNEHLPVDPEETIRYRARASNWFYMQDASRSSYHCGKSGQCARDLVAECRRCGIVVCRNCAIKPPAPIVHRDRHRRICVACANAPLGALVRPPLGADVPLDSEDMQRGICKCDSDGVWLCQPCGRTIRSDDNGYKGIWRWRLQYTEVLGGLGTGIGEGDRGVICGRDSECCAAREREQYIDCDAADAREADMLLSRTNSNGNSALAPWGAGSASSTSSLGGSTAGTSVSGGQDRRTPSPQLKPGYERHEIEGIGGVMKKKLVRMVKVAACVPEWPEEKEILGREVRGLARSWCGWCWRIIPGATDLARKGDCEMVV
ncbi:hypothetical protein B0T22DRAFT_231943 [Podospora appendiculata]|uniref:Uncharacterized protein n=1 Tax=Podospora appendiculata TaxID=314037 RepID=A0AAE0X655_9PEZI|nr:hypothetical protein B0T22DRAFT_231943 [Podospora appendiculata]